jgi:hypothetical protein
VPNRLQAIMVIALAMISVFTLGAGAAVAALMPARLALWNIPRVTTRPAAAAPRVNTLIMASAITMMAWSRFGTGRFTTGRFTTGL